MIRIQKCISLLVCLIFFSFQQFAQTNYLRQFLAKDGIHSNYIYSTLQDRDGYIWFSTDVGVSKFDGYSFQNYTTADGVPDTEILTLFQDSKNRIWMLSLNGEVGYYEDGKFYNSSNSKLLRSIESISIVTSIFESNSGEILISTRKNGMYQISSSNKLTHIPSEMSIYKVWQTENDQIACVGGKGIYQLIDGQLDLLVEKNLSKSYPRSTLRNDTLYVGYDTSLFIFYNGTFKSYNGRTTDSEITCIDFIGDELCVGTRKGVYFDFGARNTPKILNGSIISSIFQDKENNLWISTLGDGVYLQNTPGLLYFGEEILPNYNKVSTFHLDEDNDLWIGNRKGQVFLLNQEEEITIINDEEANSVTKIRQFRGRKYICSKSGLYTVDRHNTPKVILKHLINDIYFDRDYVYLACNRLFQLTHAEFEQLVLKDLSGEQLINELLNFQIYSSDVFCLEKGAGAALYVGTSKGLYVYTKGQLEFLGTTSRYFESSIQDLAFSKSTGKLLVATSRDGLVVYKGTDITSLTKKNGLGSNFCSTVYLDGDKALVGTGQGVYQIDLDKKSYAPRNIGQNIGLMPLKVNAIATRGSTLYLATDIGLFQTNLKFVPADITPQKVNIQSFKANALRKKLDGAKLLLNDDENSIEVSFIALCFKNPGNIDYNYRLLGYSDQWRKTRDLKVVYESLPPGEYTFEIAVVSNSGERGPVSSVQFTIDKPYWQKSWFILICAIGIVTIIAVFWVLRVRRIRQRFSYENSLIRMENEKLEFEKAYNIAEQKAGSLQMNPHFIFNSLNTIKAFYVQNKFPEANRYMAKFSKLLRNILTTNEMLIPLSREIEIISLYSELMEKRYGSKLSFQLKCDVHVKEEIFIPPMIVQPLVENAFIHGLATLESGYVEVRFEQQEDQLFLTVIDNGVGFKEISATTHESVGLENIRLRLEYLSRFLKKETAFRIISPIPQEKAGTIVKITLPILTQNYDRSNN